MLEGDEHNRAYGRVEDYQRKGDRGSKAQVAKHSPFIGSRRVFRREDGSDLPCWKLPHYCFSVLDGYVYCGGTRVQEQRASFLRDKTASGETYFCLSDVVFVLDGSGIIRKNRGSG